VNLYHYRRAEGTMKMVECLAERFEVDSRRSAGKASPPSIRKARLTMTIFD
jgi:hypothetical protein